MGRLVLYRDTVMMLARREFLRRFRGGILGPATVVAVPLAFLATYTFVFSELIPVRIAPESDPASYATFLFTGLVSWNLFSETVQRSSRVFLDQAQLVRKAHFPPSAPAVALGLAAFYSALLWAGALVIYRIATGELPEIWTLAAPLGLISAAAVSVGLGLIVAHAGVFIRDLPELLPPLLTLGLFVSPVFFPAERLSALSPWLLVLNPIAGPLQFVRATLLEMGPPDPSLVLSTVASPVIVLSAGWLVHRQLRTRLVDAL